MTFLRAVLFLTVLAVISTRNVAYGQDEFGQVLLEAFTTGLFNGEPADSQPTGPTQTPAANAFPAVTLQPAAPEPSSELTIESPEETFENFLDQSPEGSSDELLVGTPEESSEVLVSGSPEESPEQSAEASSDVEPSPTAIVAFAADLLGSPEETAEDDFDNFSPEEEGSINGILSPVRPIRVNCGSFDDRNTFSQDTRPWFSNESVAVEDPFSAAQFNRNSEALLYSTYRYSAENLTYSVPIPNKGVWRVTLQWAEIVPVFMQDGARMFSVYINGKEFESEVDVYNESQFGSFSPLIRTYMVDAYASDISITLGQNVGEPMLSAFQLSYVSPLAG